MEVDSEPSPRLWLYILTSTILAYFIFTTFQSYWRLRHIKGPPLAAFTTWWWVRASVSTQSHIALADACTKYGSIARIGPNLVVTCDEELLRKMNAWRGSTYTKGDWYKAFKLDADRENVFSQTAEDSHTKMRNRVTVGYSGKDNPTLEPDLDSVLWSLIDLIRRKYLSRRSELKPMDFADKAQSFTLDVITSLSLGEPFGFVAEDIDKYEFMKTLEDNFPIMNVFAAIPVLSAIMRMPSIQKFVLPSVKDRVGLGKAKAVARELISRRFGEKKEVRADMTGSFIQHGMTQAEIADESMLQILVGSDTAATIIRTGFISIISNPQIHTRLLAELDAATATIPLQTIIPNTTALTLPYLQACIKESLRHHPAAGGLLPRVVGPAGDTHNTTYLPPGTEVGVSTWKMQRFNTTAYGPDAHIFRPERWLDCSPEQLARMERTFDLTWAYGRFRCLGENIAKIELNKVFFELFRRFEWSLIDPLRPLEKNANYGLFVQKGMWVRVSERERDGM